MNILGYFHKLNWQWDRADFYSNLSDALKRKVALRSFLERELSNATMLKLSSQIYMINKIMNRLSSGNGSNLQDMLKNIAPDSDQLMLSSVDNAPGPDQPTALLRLVEAISFQKRSFITLMQSLATPILAIPIVAAICIITSRIIESIAKDAPSEVWVGFNGYVKTFALFINSNWPYILISFILLAVLIIHQLPRFTGKLRLKIDSWPIFGLYRDYNSAIVLSSMAMLLSSKKGMRESLEQMREKGSPWLKWQINRVINSLENNPSDYMHAFSRGLLSPTILTRIASLLDSANNFEETLVTMGTSEIKRLESNIKVASDGLGWLLIIVIGSAAVFLSIGQMTIATGLANATDPSTVMMKKQSGKQ